MIARVYPLTRLPRRFSFFDYKIPPELSVEPGDLVAITFRRRPVFGVVKELQETSELKRLFSIKEIAWKQLLTPADVHRLEQIAKATVQSPATIFHHTFGFLKMRDGEPGFAKPTHAQPLTVSKHIAKTISDALQKGAPGKSLFVQTSIEGNFALAHALQNKTKGQCLIVTPRARMATELADYLPHQEKTAVLTGHTPAREREFLLRAWREGRIQTLIGTRLSPLLPAHQVETIAVLESSSDDYLTLERNPRIDARAAAELLAKQHGAALFHTGPFPDVVSLHLQREILWSASPDVRIVNLKEKQEFSGVPMLSEPLLSGIWQSLQSGKNVLISHNRTQSAEGAFSLGNEDLKEQLRQLFPQARIGVVDKFHKESGDILLVTEAYFKNVHPPFSPKRFDLIAELAFDLSFSDTDYRAAEKAAYRLYRLMSIARQQGAKTLVQTWMPEAVEDLLKGRPFLEAERETRARYRLPPVIPRAEITCPEQPTQFLPLDSETRETLLHQPDNCIIFADTPTYETNGAPSPE